MVQLPVRAQTLFVTSKSIVTSQIAETGPLKTKIPEAFAEIHIAKLHTSVTPPRASRVRPNQ
ncbi:hypothetical protein M407DRAFT_35032 [Tulasnella calospora MUT 4182]|uniref:Uncharacterized protein n=1 Tax=Tulasnella calospora MUT 4182 TaxID=1051891 RepID=A0A0C3L0Z9_9AGAM|nr:hypothetical protein M407DRAFT_35032 [Tulasnella calospora MUT 4182]